MKWKCKVCGYEMEGDKPIDICPICGVDSSNFEAEQIAKSENMVETYSEEELKTAIRQFSYGMYVITSEFDGIVNGQAANSVMQLTSQPRQISVCMNKSNYTTSLVLRKRELVVNVIGQDEYNAIANFGFSSGRDRNKFESYKYEMKHGSPYLKDHALSGLFCQIDQEIDVGTHKLFICSIKDGFVNNNKKGIAPLTYLDFRKIKEGGSIEAKKEAKIEVQENKVEVKEKSNKDKYVCKICGYVYDPEIEGTPFEDLPDTYVCPLCGAPKSDFEAIK